MTTKQSNPEEPIKNCPICGSDKLNIGYGLAGGGLGSYIYCEECGKVVQKWQDR